MGKKILIVTISCLLCFMLLSCTKETTLRTDSLEKEGVQPYEYTESDTEILESFNLQDRANIISFKAPKSARNIEVNTFVLNKNYEWEDNGSGIVSIASDDSNNLEGTISILLNEDYSIDFIINTMGKASYKTDKIVLDQQIVSSSRDFLSQYKEIKLNRQIPIAIMVYDSGNSMATYSIDDYFNPQKFQGMDLVQAVIINFTDNGN